MNNMNKQQRDNRANQMNPNNIAYYKSRMGSTSKKQSSNNSYKSNNPKHQTSTTAPKSNSPKKQTSGNYNQQKKPTQNNYTTNNKNIKVVHVHEPKNEGYCCPICGKPGGLHTAMFGAMKCNHCGARFNKNEIKR